MDKVYGQAMHEKTPDDANPSTRNPSPGAKVEVQMQIPREYINSRRIFTKDELGRGDVHQDRPTDDKKQDC